MTVAAYAINAVIWLGRIAFLYYAVRQRKAGLLGYGVQAVIYITR